MKLSFSGDPDNISGEWREVSRLQNYHAVLECIVRDGPQSQAVIADRLSLSQASVSRAATALMRCGLLRQVGRIGSDSGSGRRQVIMDVDPATALVAAVQMSPDSLRLRLSNLKGEPVVEATSAGQPTDLKDLLSRIKALLDGNLEGRGAPLVALALGMPGAWDASERQVHAIPNASFLEGVDLESAIAKRLSIDVQVDNDVNCAVLGEHARGRAVGVSTYFYLNIGSGVGGGALVNGTLHRGANGFAGEVGYLPIPDGPRHVMLESLIAHAAIDAEARRSQLAPDASGLLAKVETGDAATAAFADRLAGIVAFALASVVTVLSPELVVLGGGIGRRMGPIVPLIDKHLAQLVRQQPAISIASLGEDASLVGATSQALRRARYLLVDSRIPEVISH